MLIRTVLRIRRQQLMSKQIKTKAQAKNVDESDEFEWLICLQKKKMNNCRIYNMNLQSSSFKGGAAMIKKIIKRLTRRNILSASDNNYECIISLPLLLIIILRLDSTLCSWVNRWLFRKELIIEKACSTYWQIQTKNKNKRKKNKVFVIFFV